jgi:regulator of extracellular matrix RemA (YlzA/DUF370 family)
MKAFEPSKNNMKQKNGVILEKTVSPVNGWLAIGEAGFIQQERIVSIAPANSAPLRRLLKATSPAMVVVLTGGQRRQTAVLLDSGHLILTAISLAEWEALLQKQPF